MEYCSAHSRHLARPVAAWSSRLRSSLSWLPESNVIFFQSLAISAARTEDPAETHSSCQIINRWITVMQSTVHQDVEVDATVHRSAYSNSNGDVTSGKISRIAQGGVGWSTSFARPALLATQEGEAAAVA